MKTLIQKVLIEENHSFACRTYLTPNFETNWHKHEETELIVITEGFGTVLIGDYVGEYKTGDVFFIAGNMPHWFRKNHDKMIGSAIVAQFRKDIFGKEFLKNPELHSIEKLLRKDTGILLEKKLGLRIRQQLKQLESTKKYFRMSLLLDMLHAIGSSKEFKVLTNYISSDEKNTNPVIEKIIDYTFRHYLDHITLKDIAGIAQMSIPTFCRFFRKNTIKTYFQFLPELRINYAFKLLNITTKPILEICYESGYNSWAHFSKQFRVVKQTTPRVYRKEFSEN